MKILPVFNMKGGVAKTTTAVMVSEVLSEIYRARILLVDADPQLNATRMLLPKDKIAEALDAKTGQTLAMYLWAALGHATLPDPNKFVLRNVGNIKGAGQIDLLAGTPRTHHLDQDMHSACSNPGKNRKMVIERAAEALKALQKAGPYDLIVVDCPPSLTMPVQSALAAATLLLVPTVADDTAHAGIFAMHWTLKNDPHLPQSLTQNQRVLVTRLKSTDHARLSQLAGFNVLDSKISEADKIKPARLFDQEIGPSLARKYSANTVKELRRLAGELAAILNIVKAPEAVTTPRESADVERITSRRNIFSRAFGNNKRETAVSEKTGDGDQPLLSGGATRSPG